MREKTWFLELLGRAVEGREALAASRIGFTAAASREETGRCPTGRPERLHLIALRDLAPLPKPRPA